MSGPKRNPDKLNTIGVVVVGICGAVLVYVSIVALQAFYMGDSSEVQTMADYGGQDTAYRSLRTTQISNISEYAPNAPDQGKQTYRISIDHAIKLVAEDAKRDPGNLVPTQGRSAKATIQPVFGRPKMAAPAAAPAPADTTAPATGAAAGTEVQLTPTGGLGPGGGQPTGQNPAPEAPPAGGGSAAVNPTGAQPTSPATTAPKGGNPPTPRPTSRPKATAPKAAGSATAPKGNGR